MKKVIFHITIIIFTSMFFWRCSKEVSQEELIDAAVKIRLQQWEETQLKTCKDNALLKAESYVDSILIVISLDSKLDTIPKPEKPTRPPKPTFKKKPDTVVVEPIYKKD